MMQRFLPLLALAGLMVALPVDVHAQGYFGRNKVQYRAINMQVIETEHFLVHFDENARLAAMNAAQMAERTYTRLSRILQHQFREKKPIIIYASHSDFQQTNAIPDFIDEGTGAFAEPLKNRVVLPFTGSYKEFEHVLTHELVHAFQFDVLFGRSLMTDANPFGRPPLWYMEGMAEYLSLGRIDALTAAWVRDGALSGYLRTIQEMSNRDDYLSYRFGQSLWQYIGSRWGDEVIGIILQQTPRIGIVRAFERTLGISIDQLNSEWIASVRETYLPEVTDYDRPESFSTLLTHHRGLNDPWFLAPAISPDGNDLVFLSQRSGFGFDLWLADARTGQIRRKLVAAARNADFESLRFLNSSASFSPDGRYIAFAAQTGGRDALYIMDIQRNRTRKLEFPELNGISNPTWSPDGQQIAFSGSVGGLSDLFVTDVNGRELRRLTNDRYTVMLPAWSPDGRTIAFTTDRGEQTDFDRLTYGNYRVALYHLDTNEIELLPFQEEGKNSNPVWSPDGRSLVWVSDRTGVNNLYLYEFDEQKLYRITDLLSGAIGVTPLSPVLSWSSRDGRLVFVYFEQAGYNLYAVEDPRQLPRVPVEDPAPALLAADDVTPQAPGNGGDASPDVVAMDMDLGDVRAVTSYYRDGDRIRPSALLPDSPHAAQHGPVTVLDLLGSPDLALPDTTEFVVRNYSVRFTPDVVGRPTIGASVGGWYGNGIFGGSYVSLSDMLGNHNIVVAGNINGSFSDANFLAGYTFLKNRANWAIFAEQVPFYRYWGGGLTDDVPGAGGFPTVINVFQRDVMRSLQGIVAYPFSTFRRVELGVAGVHMKRDFLYRGYFYHTGEPIQHDERIGSMKYLQPTAALVFDNSIFGWTGPIVGRRYRMQVSQTAGDFQFTEGLLDFRNYINIKTRFVLAARFIAITRRGPDSDRFPMFWGGPYLLRGYDGGSFNVESRECVESRRWGEEESLSPCPVRDQLIGSSGALMNLEFRMPIVEELQIGFLGNFPPMDLVAFFDGGVAWANHVCTSQTSAWDPERCPPEDQRKVTLVWDRKASDPYLVREPLFSYGLGLRLNVFYTVLRLDYSIPLNRPDDRGRFSLSIGPSF